MKKLIFVAIAFFITISMIMTALIGCAGDDIIITMGSTLQAALRQPVLASSLTEPVGPAEDLLICLQSLDD